jgi:hypothetical protein
LHGNSQAFSSFPVVAQTYEMINSIEHQISALRNIEPLVEL